MSDIRNLLQSLEIEAAPERHRHGRSGWVQLNCPDCGEGLSKYHLGIDERTCKANCWNCGPKSTADVLTRLSSLPYREVQQALKSLLPSSGGKVGERAIPTRLKLPAGTGKLLRRHREYLRDRGFDVAELKRLWHLKGTAISTGCLSWRIVIPVMLGGKAVSWTARAIGNDPVRYYSLDEDKEVVPHKSTLFGLDYINGTAIVHEGPFDAMATGPGAVCTFGTSFTAGQLARLAKLRRVVTCFDSTKDAQRRAMQLIDYLEPFPVECINAQIDAKDAADALLSNPKELKSLRKLAFGR